jgi:excisionase family DNA binding protein
MASSQAVRTLAVNINEAAKLLNVCTATVRREIDRGRLRGLKIGRVWRIRSEELQRYLQFLEKQMNDVEG